MTYDRLWAWGWTLVVVAGLGLTMMLWSTLDVAVLVAALSTAAWVAQILLRPVPATEAAAPRSICSSREVARAACVGGAVAAVVGVLSLSPALVALLALLAVISSPVALRWAVRRSPEGEIPDPVMSWSDAQLEAAWRDAHFDLGRAACVADIAELAALRQRHLDELEQRDPRAFARWLEHAASYRSTAPDRAAG
jgi:hypothetical protein